MATDPPAPDLGAIRERLETHAIWLGEMRTTLDSPKIADDIRALLAALGAQEARLAALEQLLLDWQDHLLRVHRIACDYPLRADLVDYPGKEEHQEDDQEQG